MIDAMTLKSLVHASCVFSSTFSSVAFSSVISSIGSMFWKTFEYLNGNFEEKNVDK